MKKNIHIITTMVLPFLLPACGLGLETNQTIVREYDKSKINISEKNEKYYINKSSESSFHLKVNYINDFLEKLSNSVGGYENIKIASTSTGVSNFLNHLGIEMTAVTNSEGLNSKIKQSRLAYSDGEWECNPNQTNTKIFYRKKGAKKGSNSIYNQSGCYEYKQNENHSIVYRPDIKPIQKPKIAQKKITKNSLYNLGNPLKPSLEILKASRANVIFSSSSILNVTTHSNNPFYNNGIPTLYIPTESFEDIFVVLKTIGNKLANPKTISQLWKKFYEQKKEINKLKPVNFNKDQKAVFLLKAGKNFYVENKKNAVISIAKELEFEIVKDIVNTSPQKISKESLVKINPDIIIILIHGYSPELALTTKQSLSNLDWIKETKAYQKNQIIVTRDMSLVTHQIFESIIPIVNNLYKREV